jgi:hypothetical protein
LAIKNIWIGGDLVLVAFVISTWFFPSKDFCYPITRNLVVKTGAYVPLSCSDDHGIRAKNASIPVPKVYCSFILEFHVPVPVSGRLRRYNVSILALERVFSCPKSKLEESTQIGKRFEHWPSARMHHRRHGESLTET